MTSEPIQTSTVHGAPPELELLDPRNRTDPYQVYAALREGPALRKSFLGYWIAARYAEVAAILKDTRFVASASAAGLSEAAASEAGRAGSRPRRSCSRSCRRPTTSGCGSCSSPTSPGKRPRRAHR